MINYIKYLPVVHCGFTKRFKKRSGKMIWDPNKKLFYNGYAHIYTLHTALQSWWILFRQMNMKVNWFEAFVKSNVLSHPFEYINCHSMAILIWTIFLPCYHFSTFYFSHIGFIILSHCVTKYWPTFFSLFNLFNNIL